MTLRVCLLVICLVGLSGCRSRLIDVTIANNGPGLHVMEFDYPSASFGANNLATGARYQYRIKVQGPGAVSLQYEDATGHNRSSTGPKVDLGDEGTLMVDVDQAGGMTWSSNLSHKK